MNTFTYVFFAALLAGTLLRWWLVWRQLRSVNAHRAAVPEAFRDTISLDKHQRAADYTAAKTRLAMVDIGIGAVVLLVWTVGGGIDALDAAWRSLDIAPIVAGTCLLLSAFLIMGLIELPLDWYRTFVIEARFGFNRTTPALFVMDALKHALLTVAIGAPIILLVLWLMAHAGDLWWLWVWLVWMGFSMALTWAYPTLIAPIFNKFMPLEDAALEARIEALLERNGFQSRGVYVMDGSKRSGHGNAYFTGFGGQKRIVFFDTLLEQLDAEEIEAVLAHELGHFKCRHVIKRIVLMAVLSLAGLVVLGWLIDAPWFYAGLGVTEPSIAVALLLFLMVAPVFTVFVQPVMTGLSRRHEYEADDYAAHQTEARHLISALVKLYRENAATLTPDPLYSAFHDSHPPAPLRIASLERSG